MPLGNFLPASQSLGKSTSPFPEDDTSSAIQGVLQRIQSGQPHYDPSSARNAPVPPSIQATPQQRAGAFAPGPGDIGGGIEGGLPFSVKAGLGTGGFGQGGGAGTGGGTRPSSTGPAGSQTSSVVGNMLGGATSPAGTTPQDASVSYGIQSGFPGQSTPASTTQSMVGQAQSQMGPVLDVMSRSPALQTAASSLFADPAITSALMSNPTALDYLSRAVRDMGATAELSGGGGTAREIGPAETANPEREFGRGG